MSSDEKKLIWFAIALLGVAILNYLKNLNVTTEVIHLSSGDKTTTTDKLSDKIKDALKNNKIKGNDEK